MLQAHWKPPHFLFSHPLPCPRYNVLHLRVEKDWLALCEWWQKPEEG